MVCRLPVGDTAGCQPAVRVKARDGTGAAFSFGESVDYSGRMQPNPEFQIPKDAVLTEGARRLIALAGILFSFCAITLRADEAIYGDALGSGWENWSYRAGVSKAYRGTP